MPLSRESRDFVRAQFGLRASEIGERYRKESDRARQTMPRSGAAEAFRDEQDFSHLSELAAMRVSLYLEAYDREGVVPSDTDVSEICSEIEQIVYGALHNPLSRHHIGFSERCRQIVPRCRMQMLSAVNRMKVMLRKENETMISSPTRQTPLRISIDDIESFGQVRGVDPSSVADVLDKGYLNLTEDEVQTAIEEILSVPMHKKDWSGEINDLYTANLVIDGRRVAAAFMLKGGGLKSKVMEIRDCGKNGDQLLRLMDSPASLFVVQFVGVISENVIRDLEMKVSERRAQGKPASYCIIDGQDTARLLRAYAKL